MCTVPQTQTGWEAGGQKDGALVHCSTSIFAYCTDSKTVDVPREFPIDFEAIFHLAMGAMDGVWLWLRGCKIMGEDILNTAYSSYIKDYHR